MVVVVVVVVVWISQDIANKRSGISGERRRTRRTTRLRGGQSEIERGRG